MHCTNCGRVLPWDNPHWKKKCLDCFKQGKQAERGLVSAEDHDVLFQLYMSTASKLRVATAEVARLKAGAGLSSDMLTKLLLLCHPDHHANSPLSNEVTRYLIGLRQETRE